MRRVKLLSRPFLQPGKLYTLGDHADRACMPVDGGDSGDAISQRLNNRVNIARREFPQSTDQTPQ